MSPFFSLFVSRVSVQVNWVPVSTPFSRRFERYLRDDFLESHIHWFSLVNSVMMVLFLSGMVALILVRTLRRDLQFYRDVEAAGTEDDDSGWKQVHADVFRPPPGLTLLAALLGSGLQLCFLAAAVILLAFFGELHEERGVLLTFAALLYALSSALGGMLSGSFYQQNGGKQWIRTALLTAVVFPGAVAAVGLVLDLMATAYRSQSSIPLGTLALLVLLWAVVAFPLTVIGSMVGRHVGPFRGPPPCKVERSAAVALFVSLTAPLFLLRRWGRCRAWCIQGGGTCSGGCTCCWRARCRLGPCSLRCTFSFPPFGTTSTTMSLAFWPSSLSMCCSCACA